MIEQQNANELRQLARKLAVKITAEMLQLGNVLLAIHSNRHWEGWGYDDWHDYVHTEIGMSAAASYRLLSITRWIHSERLLKAQREAVVSLGRTKAYYLTLVARKPTLDKWLTRAKKMTGEQLRSAVYSTSGEWETKCVAFNVTRAQLRTINTAIMLARDYYDDPDEPVRGDALATACEKFIASEKKSAARRRKTG
jgi:hypothetical protein